MMQDINVQKEIEKLQDRIQVLNNIAWQEREMEWSDYQKWVNNFSKSECRVSLPSQEWAALHLLSKFLYFNDKLIRKLLRTLYLDIFRTPLIHKIRRNNNDTLEKELIENKYKKELDQTRFIGMGNPSESGCHLLYYFRQENSLVNRLFIHGHEALSQHSLGEGKTSKHKISRYVFIDDFCGTGKQAIRYSKELVSNIKKIDSEFEAWYCPLVGTVFGLEEIEKQKIFNKVQSVLVLDDTFKSFSEGSRYFRSDQVELKRDSRILCEYYGGFLVDPDSNDRSPLGYGDCQLLIGFHHNTPNNTLPVFWGTGADFYPIFHRYPKIF